VRAAGLVIWLTATEATICSRLAADSNSESQRPALTGADSMSEVSQVLRERIPLYQASAQAEVDAEEPLAQVVARVVELWQEMIA
ncbi:MAG: shikimate kinase, partial [Thermodesulfobacteriota bacterium]